MYRRVLVTLAAFTKYGVDSDELVGKTCFYCGQKQEDDVIFHEAMEHGCGFEGTDGSNEKMITYEADTRQRFVRLKLVEDLLESGEVTVYGS